MSKPPWTWNDAFPGGPPINSRSIPPEFPLDPVPPPLVTIGVPVYNEARFLDASLRSLREQDYSNLDIVVSDNASTDGTVAICERHAAEDPRVRIERADANRGATANFQHAFEAARGRYFMWAAGHDLWTPGLVSECVALLEAHPRACLAFPGSRWIDGDGNPLARETGWTDTRGLGAAGRFFTVLWGNMHPVMGVMRTDALRACGPLPNLVGGDLVLLARLALRGDFLHASSSSWSRREFRAERSYGEKVRRYASAATGIARSPLARAFPLLELPLALSATVIRSPLPPVDKAAALLALLASFPIRYIAGRRQGDA